MSTCAAVVIGCVQPGEQGVSGGRGVGNGGSGGGLLGVGVGCCPPPGNAPKSRPVYSLSSVSLQRKNNSGFTI